MPRRRPRRLRLRPPGRVRGAARRLRDRWRRSLQLRVVTTTVLLVLLVVLVVGQVLLGRIRDGLVASRTETVSAESRVGLEEFADNYATNTGKDVDFPTFVNDQIDQLQGPADDPTRYVVLRHALGATDPAPISDRASSAFIDISAVPADLRTAVVADPDRLHTRLLLLPVRDSDGRTTAVRTIAVGGVIDLGATNGGSYELYFLYRLDREVEILALVQRIFLVGGVALVLLPGVVAWVLSRQVVVPVRRAARTAEELAAGRLDRRLPVRGQDELARLARAFNGMAAGLERQIHRLEELSRVQRRFVSDVSHELRTPLTTVRMASEVMYESRDGFDPAARRSAELLRDQLDRFEELLADLLEVSRFDAGAAVLEPETADLRVVAHRVVEGLRPLAERRGAAVVLLPGPAAAADVDVRRIERVLRNLVGNAIEHSEGRPVELTVAADGRAAAVGVRDHGIGLRPDDREAVFERFWRADPARARTTGGTGLGLAIALEDTRLHDGWLQAWGLPGRGANFRLTVPVRRGTVLTCSPLPLVPPDAQATLAGPGPAAEGPA